MNRRPQKFTVEVLVGNRWQVTAYQELPLARARCWLAFMQRARYSARIVQAAAVSRSVH